MKQAVQVAGTLPRPANQSAKGIFLDGSTIELTMKDMLPKHDSALGVHYLEAAPVEGRRWKPVHGMRMTTNGEYAGGPGWFEPLDDADALPPGSED